MSVHVSGVSLTDAWLKAYTALASARNHAVNLTVTVSSPGIEHPSVRRAIDSQVAMLQAQGHRQYNKSVHTVANTIFPMSLYRRGRVDAFYDAAKRGQSGRQGTVTSWGPKSGTYIGRLLDYPTFGGATFNQLARMLKNLDADRNYRDFYELSLSVEPPDPDPSTLPIFAGASTFVPDYDNSHRGGQCLSHISLHLSSDGRLSMAALYRHQTYLTRAYGNFLGLSRLLHFLVHESRKDLEVGELMVVASHAEIEPEARSVASQLIDSCTTSIDAEDPTSIEFEARPFGAKWSDLELPAV